MKKFISEFLRRGVWSASIGPLFLAVLYLILYNNGAVEALSVKEVSVGIFSLTFLAFAAGGLNAIYQIENLPLMVAILIHGVILYPCYLATYLLNGWLDLGMIPVLVFTAIFIIGYFVIWSVIYLIIKKKTDSLNKMLKKKQESENSN